MSSDAGFGAAARHLPPESKNLHTFCREHLRQARACVVQISCHDDARRDRDRAGAVVTTQSSNCWPATPSTQATMRRTGRRGTLPRTSQRTPQSHAGHRELPALPAGVKSYALRSSALALVPAMKPWQVARAKPCMLNPPADSPPQYSPGITSPFMSTTWHLALMRNPARVS